MVAVVAIDDVAAAAAVSVVVAVAFHVPLIVAVAFPVQSMDRKTLISVNSVPRIVFLLIWVSAVYKPKLKFK